MSVFDILEEIASDNSRLHKEAVLRRERNHPQLSKVFKLAYDPYIQFYQRKIPDHKPQGQRDLDWALSELDQLSSRTVTGNAAINHLTEILGNLSAPDAVVITRIIGKDLRCGVSEKTVNKVVAKEWPQYAVPVFECQLAHDGANHESKINGQKLIEVKLDGVRVITVVYPDGRVDQFSRNGKELANFPHIREQMAKMAGMLDEPHVFDGEVMSQRAALDMLIAAEERIGDLADFVVPSLAPG